MSNIFASDTFRLSHLVKQEFWDQFGWCRKQVTINESADKTYGVGTVLGKVTATGKYKIAVESAVDGSNVPAALVLEDKKIVSGVDTKLVVLYRGPCIVSKDALVLDASFNTDTKKSVVYAALEALNIAVNETI
jgi:hypothetical protein